MSERPGLEAFLEIVETCADQLMSNELVADLPIVGTAIKLCQAADGIRERMFLAKLQRFINALDGISATERGDMLGLTLTIGDERKRVGEALLLTLEQLSDLNRPEVMAAFFSAYVRGRIDRPFLFRCWNSIANAYMEDLKSLFELDSANLNCSDKEGFLQNLLRTGLTKIQGLTSDNDGHMYYELSDFGRQCFQVYNENNVA